MKVYLNSASLLLILLLVNGTSFSQKGKLAKANKNFDKYAKLNTDKVEELEKIQALETLDEMKKQLNYERYVITENLKPQEEREKNKNNMLS